MLDVIDGTRYVPDSVVDLPVVDHPLCDAVNHLPTELTPETLHEITEREAAIASGIVAELKRIMNQDVGPRYNRDIYSASYALKVKQSNCMAEAALTAAIGVKAGLDKADFYGTWTGRHAAMLWRGLSNIWCLDQGGLIWGAEQSSEHSNPLANVAPAKQQKIGRLIIAQAGGRSFIDGESGRAGDELQWTPITGRLQEVHEPYVKTVIILPADEAIAMYTALGDRARYMARQPERWKALSDQIERYIPQPYPGRVVTS